LLVDKPTSNLWLFAVHSSCPSCEKEILKEKFFKSDGRQWRLKNETQLRPRGNSRPLSSDVLSKYADPFQQANLVLPISPEASAAISRRTLQLLLRDEAKVTPSNLINEIQEVIDSGKLPTELSESIDAIRNIGNFGSHPIKSTNTGEIIDVEPGEAEWNLEVLEELFDHYIIKPKRLKAKRAALDKKLADAGKKPMK